MESSAGLGIPITDPAEVADFVRGLPLAMDPGFTRFVLGFPRRYLEETPRAEVQTHVDAVSALWQTVLRPAS